MLAVGDLKGADEQTKQGLAWARAYPGRNAERALIWGLILPVVAVLGALLVHPVLLALLLVYPLQAIRLSRRLGRKRAVYTLMGKFPEAMGVAQFHLNRLRNRRGSLIEYK